MAGGILELTIVFSSAGGLTLAFAAMTVLTIPEKKFIGNSLMFVTLMVVAFPWRAYLIWIQVRWLGFGGEQPDRVKLWVLVAVEWLVACLTIGTACAALTADLFALQHQYCATTAACLISIVGAAMACAAGGLAAVSALGMLWILGSQFRPAQAP